MKLKIRYENEYRTVTLDAEETEDLWVSLSLEGERLTREERQQVMTDVASKHDLKDRFNDLASFLDEQTEAVTEYFETLVRRIISKIMVFDEKITVKFKSELSMDVDA